MKKLISILMSIVIAMGTFVGLSAVGSATSPLPPEIYLSAPNQQYIAGEEITFEVKIPAYVIKDVVYVQLLIDCNTDVLKFKTSDHSKGESAITETEKGYKIEYYPWAMATATDTYTASITFRVSEGEIDVNAHALLGYRDAEELKEARLAADLPENTVYTYDDVPHLSVAGDIAIYRIGDIIYLPYSITRSKLKEKITSTVDGCTVDYLTAYDSENEYALTGDEVSVSFDGRQVECVKICILGDINKNGTVTAADARLALRAAARLDEYEGIEKLAADVDKDGKSTSADARQILRVAASIDKFASPVMSIDIHKESLVIGGLKNAGSGAYNWKCTVSEPDAFEITEEKIGYDGEADGVPVIQSFTLKPLKVGAYTVHFELIRSWETEPIDEFDVKVYVNSAILDGLVDL